MEKTLLDLVKQVHIDIEKSIFTIESRIEWRKPYLEQLDKYDLCLFREWLRERQKDYLAKNSSRLDERQLRHLLELFSKDYGSTLDSNIKVYTKDSYLSYLTENKDQLVAMYKSNRPRPEDEVKDFWAAYVGDNYVVGVDPYDQNPAVKPIDITPYAYAFNQEDLEKRLAEVMFSKPKSKKRRKLLLL